MPGFTHDESIKFIKNICTVITDESITFDMEGVDTLSYSFHFHNFCDYVYKNNLTKEEVVDLLRGENELLN